MYQRELNIGKTVLLWQRWDEVRKVRDVSIVGVRQGVPDQHHPNPTRNGGMFLSYPSCGRAVETGIALCGVAERLSGGQLTQ